MLHQIQTKYQPVGQFEDTRFEKIHNITFKSSVEASVLVAQEIAQLIRKKQKEKANCILGLATGSSPIKVYEELVRMQLNENSTINVTNTTALISLAPGEFKIYADNSATLSTEDVALKKNSLQLYPNPTSGSFSLSKEALEVSLYDIAGKRVKQFTKNTIKSNLYLVPDLKTGIYFVRIKNYSNNITTKKLVLSHLR